MEDYRVADIGLAGEGEKLIRWAEAHMPVLMKIRGRFSDERPLEGIRIGCCLHVTKETAVLIRTLVAGGAEVALCGSNPLSTNDAVAAALAEGGVHVFAWRGQSRDEYYWCIEQVIGHGPSLVHDDGADLIATIHERHGGLLDRITCGFEETTTGVLRLKAMEEEGVLGFPIIAVNEARTKRLFDNRYGTGQSVVDGIMRATSVLLAGKTVVVCGYGWCGRGIAMRARGLGARVVVCEVDPVKALEAVMDGYRVMPLSEAARLGDIFITATGCEKVIRREHMELMKDGAILANAGHFNVEIWLPDLEALAVRKEEVRPCVEAYVLPDGRRLYLLGEGRLVNLVCADGHPPDVMDMSFANQALCAEYAIKHEGELEPRVYLVPDEVDMAVARLKLEALGVRIDELTPEQKAYLASWRLGT